ncbi:MAG: ATP-binding protein [Sphaerochaetaceae bacterium]|nr:ATP-binding protein [Sphaerochaetaceae bacterium]
MIEREIKDKLTEIAREYPVILIQGPRQSGKTTLCKMLFTDKPYVSMETPDVRERAENDPIGFLSNYPNGAILDEIQKVPAILSYIQGIVDQVNVPNMFILTGSNNLLLMQAVSQSLSGRVAIFNLLPFSMKEAEKLYSSDNASERILYGGYPRLLSNKMSVGPFFENYISTYVEKDVREVLKIKDAALFRKFVVLCANRIGNILDITGLAKDCGVSTKTVYEWLSILETSFICFQLQPYFVNKTKRLVKSPKLYFYDTGLACALLGIRDTEQLRKDKAYGALFENLVVLEYIKRNFNELKSEKMYYYRTSDGIEVDLVIERGRKIQPVEIKSTKTFQTTWTKGIEKFNSEYSDSVSGLVLYDGTDSMSYKDIAVKPFCSLWSNFQNSLHKS